jgi:hypothetical protein
MLAIHPDRVNPGALCALGPVGKGRNGSEIKGSTRSAKL